jgi:D-glycero-D-manno-heptose 1,7-bisphosphate phosphatase
VANPQDVRLIEGASDGALMLSQGGYELVIVSNQSGIARGFMSEQQADAVDRQLLRLLEEQGVNISAVYRCPHLVAGVVAQYAIECDCRKPKPGLLLRAAHERGLDLSRSWAIGDNERDVLAGLAAGCKAVLLCNKPKAASRRADVQTAHDLRDAAALILKRS